jgi:cell division protein FtsW
MLTTTARSPRTAGRPESRSKLRGREQPTVKNSSYWVIIFAVTILSLVGLVMVLSASSILSINSYGTPWHYFIRQGLWLLLGLAAFLVASRVGYERLRPLARPLMALTLLMLMAVLVIGVRSNGAARWIGTSSVQIQPSEFAKLALVLYAADVLDRRTGKGTWLYRCGPVLGLLGFIVLLVMAQPDMGTSMVLCVTAVAMLFTAGVPGRYLGAMAGVGVMGALLLAKAAPYRWQRMTSFLHPMQDAQNTGYQAVQGLYALSQGHALGDGIGTSIASYGYLPNAQTDFIFAVIGEETGMVGGFFVAGLFMTLMLAGTRVACRAPSRYAALVASGITTWLVGQAVINIGAVVGLLPVTGVPLPFVSFGGSALVISLFAVGLLADIAKRS